MRSLLLLPLVLALLLFPCAACAEVEMLAANVGKGDALLLRAGDYVCLIDTGKRDAQEALQAALEYWQVDALDAVFITHTDKDHVGGLKWLRKSGIEIRAVYASKYHPETAKKKHQAVKTAEKLGLEVNWLAAGDEIALGEGGAWLLVLAPEREIAGNEDDNSLVMLLDSPDGRILLTGDMEHKEEALLLTSDAELNCDVLKVPNHGDGDACSAQLIRACEAKLAVISTSSEEKPDTPDKAVLRNLKEAGCEILITQDSDLGVLVTLRGGEVSAQYI